VTPSQKVAGHRTELIKHMFKFSSPPAYWTASDFRQPYSVYDWKKRWALVSRRNVVNQEAVLVCGGRLLTALQPQEMCGRRDLSNELTAHQQRRADRQNEDDDEQRPLMSAVGCLLDTLVLCSARNDYARTLNRIHSGTRNQCSSWSNGVVCSNIRRE